MNSLNNSMNMIDEKIEDLKRWINIQNLRARDQINVLADTVISNMNPCELPVDIEDDKDNNTIDNVTIPAHHLQGLLELYTSRRMLYNIVLDDAKKYIETRREIEKDTSLSTVQRMTAIRNNVQAHFKFLTSESV